MCDLKMMGDKYICTLKTGGINMRTINEYGLMEFDEKKVVGEAVIKLQITEEDVDNIVVGAIEGGIGYWARLENTGLSWKDKPKNVASSQWASHLLLNGDVVIFSDAELEEGDQDYYFPSLTLQGIINGISLNAKERPHDSDLENMDATTVDCIIQYAIFGELVYG